MQAIISDFNASNKDFLAQSRLYSGRFQEEFGPSSLLANNNMSVAAAVLKKVESLRTGLKDGGSSGGAGGSGDGTKDIVSILTEIRDLLVKQGRGELNAKFGTPYLSPTGIARTIIQSSFKESNVDMMWKVLEANLQKSLPKWTDEERATDFGLFGDVTEFEKQREYFDLHYNEDLSLAEIAQSEGVSRQSVWDIIRRAEETMRRFEEKTGLVARFAAERDILAAAREKLARLETMTDGDAQRLAREIAAALQELGHGI